MGGCIVPRIPTIAKIINPAAISIALLRGQPTKRIALHLIPCRDGKARRQPNPVDRGKRKHDGKQAPFSASAVARSRLRSSVQGTDQNPRVQAPVRENHNDDDHTHRRKIFVWRHAANDMPASSPVASGCRQQQHQRISPESRIAAATNMERIGRQMQDSCSPWSTPRARSRQSRRSGPTDSPTPSPRAGKKRSYARQPAHHHHHQQNGFCRDESRMRSHSPPSNKPHPKLIDSSTRDRSWRLPPTSNQITPDATETPRQDPGQAKGFAARTMVPAGVANRRQNLRHHWPETSRFRLFIASGSKVYVRE